jgi:hypothetical protein
VTDRNTQTQEVMGLLDGAPEFVRQMAGTIELGDSGLEELKKARTKGIKLDIATDGGLKDGVGTTGVVIVKHNKVNMLLHAYSMETEATLEGITSTREELRAQVAACYLVSLMESSFGAPGKRIQARIITDSKASIQIVHNAEKPADRKKILDPDMDLRIEFARVNKEMVYANFQHIWTQSPPN